MSRQVNRLNSLAVKRAIKPGRLADGAGLYLQVSNGGAKSWIFGFMIRGKEREMGLGSVKTITLADARIRAAECRKMLVDGIDPIEARKAQVVKMAISESRMNTFDSCVESFLAANESGWKNEKHKAQWRNTLNQYASPVLGNLPMQAIDTALVMKVLEPIWQTKNETASRVRGRIERIISYATAREWREGENPARWRGHLDQLLPRPSKVKIVEHHKALPYQDVHSFLKKLRQREGFAALALEFTILTVGRTSQVLLAKWPEFRIEDSLWIIPAERMKVKKEHRVPLSARACEILETMRKATETEYVFPSDENDSEHFSDAALLAILKRMGLDVTTHGFRSTFSDWAYETTAHSQEVIEMAMAHTVKNKTEAAYRRGDLLEKRRKLMDDWAKYVNSPVGTRSKVIPMRPLSARISGN